MSARRIRRRLLVGLFAVAQCSFVSAASLSPVEIRAAVDQAAKQYLGDFPSDRVIRTVGADGSRFVFPVPSFGLRLWPEAWRTQINIQSAKPVEVLTVLKVIDGSGEEGAYFVYLPVSEATIDSQWIIAARVSVLFGEPAYGDG